MKTILAIQNRSSRGFSMIELLVALAITLVLMAMVSEIMSTVRSTVSIGAANLEVTTDAAVLEARLSDDFRRLNTQGFMVIKWANQGSGGTVSPAYNGNNGIIGINGGWTSVPTGTVVSGVTLSGANLWVPPGGFLGTGYDGAPQVVVLDSSPSNPGIGALISATINSSGQLIALNIVNGGSGYNALNTTVTIASPCVDQIMFFANGPWTTGRLGVQTSNMADSASTASYQADNARIWYGHLETTNNPAYSDALRFDGDPGGSVNPTTYLANTLQPFEWRLGRHQLLLAPENVHYGPLVTITDSGSGSGAVGIANVSGGAITSVTVTNGGANYTGPLVAIANPPYYPGSGTPASYGIIQSNHVVNSITVSGAAYGSGYIAYQAAQSIWQSTYINNTASTPYYYGIRYGATDIASQSDITSIGNAILSSTRSTDTPPSGYTAAVYPSASNWHSNTVGQCMTDSCFRVYGSPFITLSNLTSTTTASSFNATSDIPMLTQSVLASNCSGFEVEYSVDGTNFTRTHGTGAYITANVDPSSPYDITGFNVIQGGSGYNVGDVITCSGIGTGAVGTVTGVGGGNAITTIAVSNSGSGYDTIVPGSPPSIILVPPTCNITSMFAAGLNQPKSTITNVGAWPLVIRITATLHDQRGRIHDLLYNSPGTTDGRVYSFVLPVPQPE